MHSIFKKLFLFILLGLFIFGAWGLLTIGYEKKVYYKDLDIALKEKATPSYLDRHILEAIRHDHFDDAVMYQQLADYIGVKLKPETLKTIEENSDLLSQSWRNIKSFGTGFFFGKSDDMVGLSGSIAADMTVVGDIRDLSIEGEKFVTNQPYDKIVFGMAAIGLGLSASQFFSFGASTPVKVGASIVKAAKKTGKLSRSFVKIISSKLAKAIDFKILKKVDYSSITSVKKASKRIADSLNSSYIRKAFRNIDTLKTNTNIADSISLLKYVDNPKDLQKVVNVSKKYKKNTKAVFKILGKGVIRGIVKGTAKVVKWTSMLMAQLVSLLASLVVFMGALLGKWFGWKLFRIF